MPEPAVALDRLVLAGRNMDAHVGEAITSATYEHGLDQAATLTLGLHDPQRVFLQSAIATQRITARLGSEIYVLAQVSKAGHELTLTFEDQVVNALRQIKGPLKVRRSTVSRAGFARRLCLDPVAAGFVAARSITFWTPEAAKPGQRGTTRQGKPLPNGQPHVAKGKATSSKVVPDVTPPAGPVGPIGTPGGVDSASAGAVGATAAFPPGAHLLVRGITADANQRENCAICLATAKRMGASRVVLLAVIETIIVESSMRNLTGGDRDSVGLFQQRPSQGWQGLRNREKATQEFTSRAIANEKKYPTYTPGQLAQSVQRSAYPERYEQLRPEAEDWLAAWTGQVTPDQSLGASGSGQGYEFSRGVGETSWGCVKRLADELQWRAFVRGTTVLFSPDSALLAQPTSMRLHETLPGVEVIDFDWDAGKHAARATCTIEATNPSAIEPGQVVILEQLGIANGKWLVSDIQHDFLSAQMTVELVTPQPALPEPPDTLSKTGGNVIGKKGTTYAAGSVPDANSPGGRAVVWAHQFLGKPYCWGGGHGANGVQAMVAYGNQQLVSYTTGFDCSGLSRCAWAQQGVDVGGTTTDQIARAQSAGVPHGTGTPPGGWQAGDLNYPHAGHVVLMVGKGVAAVEAKGSAWGIVADDRGPSYFWARWGGAA
jgi:cell wall-associated NlpC family hydrolase